MLVWCLFLLVLSVCDCSHWNYLNCNEEAGGQAVVGKVTDAVCCNSDENPGEDETSCQDLGYSACSEKHWCQWNTAGTKCSRKENYTPYCLDKTTQSACDDDARCLWNAHAWNTKLVQHGQCQLNRDEFNNVCCHQNVNDVCHDVTRGRCPWQWQVSRACCSDHKYDDLLTTRNITTHTCCNTPCDSIHAAYDAGNQDCRIEEEYENKTQCTPQAKFGLGFGRPLMGGPPMLGGAGLRNLMGFRGLSPMGIGNVIPGFGNQRLEGMLGLAALDEAGDGHSKRHHVEEITVDDLMESLIEALDNDKDVFDYEREVTSDPWFKKQQFGGVKSSFSFIDPWMFISQIYGSPFGLSNAQSTYNRAYGAPRNRFSQGMGGMGMGQHQAPFWGPPPQPQAWGPRPPPPPPPQQPWGPPPPPQQPWGQPHPQQPWGQPPSQPQQPPPQPPPTSPIPPQQPPPPQQPGVSYHEHFPVPPGMPPPYPPPPPFDPWPQPPPFGGPNPFGGMNPQYPPLYPWGQPPQPPPFGGPAPNPPAGAPTTSDSGTATAGDTTSDGN